LNVKNSSLDSDGEEDDFSEEEQGDWIRLIRRSADIIQEADTFVAQLASLETTIGDIEVHFSSLFKKGDLDKELNLLDKFYPGKSGHWRTKAGERIVMLFTINNYQEAARATQEAARALGLTRPFPVVEQILDSVADIAGFRSLPLNQVSSV
jgi:hypothetical protein